MEDSWNIEINNFRDLDVDEVWESHWRWIEAPE